MNIIEKAPHPVELKSYTRGNTIGLVLIITGIAIIALETLSGLLIYKNFVSLPHQLRSIIFTFKGFSNPISLTAFEAILIGASSSAVASGIIGTLLFLKKQQMRITVPPLTFPPQNELNKSEDKKEQKIEQSNKILLAQQQTEELTAQESNLQTNVIKNKVSTDSSVHTDQKDATAQFKTDQSLKGDQQVDSPLLQGLKSIILNKVGPPPDQSPKTNMQADLEKSLNKAFDSVSKTIKIEVTSTSGSSDVKGDEWDEDPIKVASPKLIKVQPKAQPAQVVEITLKEAVEQGIQREKLLKNGIASFEIQDEGTSNERLLLIFKSTKSCGPARTRLSHLLKVAINDIHFFEDIGKGDRIELNTDQITKFKFFV